MKWYCSTILGLNLLIIYVSKKLNKMILKLVLLSIVLIGIAFLGLGIQIFFSKKKSFPQTHISENVNMKKLKISCVKLSVCDDKTIIPDECSTCCAAHK